MVQLPLPEAFMPITLILRKKEYQLEGTLTVRAALEKMGLSVETHLVLRLSDGEMLNEREHLKNGDVVKLVPVISGGGA
jgi:sulfur carrier protein ThiS